jgi:hypothetical protein
MSALIAASQASHAVSALLENEQSGGGFGDEPVVEMLAGALALAIDIHLTKGVEACDEDYRAALTALRGKAMAFLERWA